MKMRFSALLLLFAGCSASQPESANPQFTRQEDARPSLLKIVTTCGMVTDIVRQVAGDKAEVTGLMGEGIDPHLYKPTRNDIRQLVDAQIVFYSGLHLEGRMDETLEKMSRPDKPVRAVTDALDRKRLLEPPDFGGHFDPHVWMEVQLWSDCAVGVAESLGKFDSANAEVYRANAARYRAELQRLDDYARQSIASIPEPNRVLVTAHDAFGYFARAYGLSVRSVQGISTESEAGVDDINQLVSFIVDQKIRAIFVESSVPQKNLTAIIEGAKQRGWQVAIGGELYSDAMGPTGSYTGTYFGMLDHNVTQIARALGGKVPERGLNGKLTTSQ